MLNHCRSGAGDQGTARQCSRDGRHKTRQETTRQHPRHATQSLQHRHGPGRPVQVLGLVSTDTHCCPQIFTLSCPQTHTLVHRCTLSCPQTHTLLSTDAHSLVHRRTLSCPQTHTLLSTDAHSLVHRRTLSCPQTHTLLSIVSHTQVYAGYWMELWHGSLSRIELGDINKYFHTT